MEMRITFPGGARVDATYDGVVVRTDQPVGHGGAGTAPAPFDYFLASIGTCSGLYLLKFLERRGIPTTDVSLVMRTVWDRESHRVSDVDLEIRLPGNFPEKYRKAVVAAVNLCTVKQHLQNPPTFHTTVKVGEFAAA